MAKQIIEEWQVQRTMKYMLAAAAAAFAAGNVSAQDAGCSKIDGDLDRLACYDKASGRTPTLTEEPVESGKWQPYSVASKMTDRNSYYLSVESNEVVNCGWNNGARITLTVRCHEGKTALIFETDCHMTSSEYNSYGDVEYRLDAEKAKKVSTDASTNNRALGLWSGAKSIPVVKQMLGKKQMVSRMTPYGESPFTATFDIAGLDDAIKPLRKECGW